MPSDADKKPSSTAWRIGAAILALAAFCLVAWLTSPGAPVMPKQMRHVAEATVIGPGRDQRGCLRSAGYVWCEGVGKCIKPWKESCPGGTDFCRAHCAEKAGVGKEGAKITKDSGATLFCRCNELGQATDYIQP
eukprot:gnl/TRDRNA2_/TRDRNA2_183625_c0_seq1.p1 gnl/TRDRNA2_/TRDRNA2_183625_c0~~gnl/TRDRNA2_/TRDRNA2_183625_c0_seq1.p1  ORF type:complete len:134 (+),score=10.99 gnl/TRDRNA2_/TRDRNA2_183625_c0_seq1:65-466(+)